MPEGAPPVEPIICLLPMSRSGSGSTSLTPRSMGFAVLSSHRVLPLLTQLAATLEHVGFGLIEIAKEPMSLNHIARPARRDQVGRILLALARPRHDEVHCHHQRVL